MQPTPEAALRRGLDFLAGLQHADGSWRGDYGGPMFLLPMYVAAHHVARRPLPPERAARMAAYLRSVQNADGSIGLHTEDRGSMFTTVLCYVALRLLGAERADADLARMRAWIRGNGTALGAASWGKLVLAVLSLYPYDGLAPILPELWLLPRALPVHPGRMWCHSRQVYLPMAYLYGRRARIEEDELVRELRADIYDRPYEAIDFTAHRDTVAPSDNRYPASAVLGVANRVMGAFEERCPPSLRERALASLVEHIRYEDRVTSHIDIGPVNSVLNALVHHFRDPGGEEEQQSFAALEQYLSDGPDGVKMNGYNSTAVWDTAFAVQSFLATPFAAEHARSLERAHAYLGDNQITEELPDGARYFRHRARGGWGFGDRANAWPVSDCTAEALDAMLGLQRAAGHPLASSRLEDGVDLILSLQNRDGGWATYEKQRGGAWLELLNPSQVFGKIMVDHSWVECTSSCIQALVAARPQLGRQRAAQIDRAVRRGVSFIRARQRPDGGWQGAWAVCFTYGAWFGVAGLLAGGVSPAAAEIRRACGFLLQHQRPDGGWGESFESCYEGRYVDAGESRTVHTAWALMALVRAGLADTEAARRAARLLAARQLESGDWPAEPLVGVFNETTLIDYENYRRYFPIQALAELWRAGERRGELHARPPASETC